MGVKVEMAGTVPAVEVADESSKRVKIILAMLAVYIIWGSTYLAVLIALESFPAFMMSSLRFNIAGFILFFVLLMRGNPMPTKAQWRNALFIGALMLGGGTGAVGFAEQEGVASGLASLAVAAVPLWAAIFAKFFGYSPNRIEWTGIIVGLGGVALLNMENGMQGNPVGALALIIGPVCWSLGSILSRKLDLPGGMMLTAVEMIGGGVFLILVSMAVGENVETMPSLRSTLAVLYLMIFGSLIAFSSYVYLLKTVRPALATSYAYVNPVVAVLLGVVFAAEHITLTGVAAMAVILTGVALVMFGREKQKK